MSANATDTSSRPEDSTEVTWVHGNDRLERALNKPGMRDVVTSHREAMRDADRTHAMGLAALRKAGDLTQAEVAKVLGITQAAVAKTEQREDLLLSTLNAYIEALGGRARVVVTFDGAETDIDLAALRPAKPSATG